MQHGYTSVVSFKNRFEIVNGINILERMRDGLRYMMLISLGREEMMRAHTYCLTNSNSAVYLSFSFMSREMLKQPSGQRCMLLLLLLLSSLSV